MENFTHKTLKTSPAGMTYSYYLSPNFHNTINPSLPTLMLVHGYPDMAHMWSGVVTHLLTLPYPMIIPDLLGFGDSDKPKEAHYYNYKLQADALDEILDKEGVPKQNNVIPIGHDWGSATSQRYYLYHRERCIGLTLISLSYQIPSPDPFDMHKVNAETEKRFGYPQWQYWNFFTRPDAAQLMSDNIERFYEVNHGVYPSTNPAENGVDVWMREMFCTPNAMDEYVTQTGKWAGRIVELKPYARDPELKRKFVERMKRDGFEGPVNYYHSLKNNTMLEDERALCDQSGGKDLRKIEVPVLFIGQSGDWVCRVDLMSDSKKLGLVDDCTERVVQGGHWIMYENPGEIAWNITNWLNERFPVKK